MKLKYVNEQERALRIAEIEAILTDETTKESLYYCSLQVELQFLQGYENSYGEPKANILLADGRTLEIIFDEQREEFSMLIYDAEGNPMLPYYNADSVAEVLKVVLKDTLWRIKEQKRYNKIIAKKDDDFDFIVEFDDYTAAVQYYTNTYPANFYTVLEEKANGKWEYRAQNILTQKVADVLIGI